MQNLDVRPSPAATPDSYDQEPLLPPEEPQPARPHRRRWKIAGAVLAAGALAAVLIARTVGADSAPQAAFVTVDRGDIVKTITATGRVQAVQTVQVGSQISGTIASLHADFNDHVRKGQVIARLDPAQLEAQLAQARANLLAAQSGARAADAAVASAEANVNAAESNRDRLNAAMDDAQRTAARNLELFQAGLLARQALETSQAAAAQAAAQYQQARAQINQARSQLTTVRAQAGQSQAQAAQARAAVELATVNLSRAVITAPVDGVVIARNVDVGQTVAASLQAPTLFIIANDLRQMQVLADINEADVGQLGPSAKVRFTVDAFPRDTFEGRIAQVRLNPQTVQNVVTYTAVIDVDNPDLKLMPGMTANVTAVTGEARGVVRVPNAALRFRPEGAPPPTGRGQVVWKQAEEGKLVPVRVRLGLTDGQHTEVVAGALNEGDRVAVAPEQQRGGLNRLRPGPPGLFGRPARR